MARTVKYHVDGFALRHFSPDFSGTKITSMTPEGFEDAITKASSNPSSTMMVIQSDMPFCRYVILHNFTEAKPGAVSLFKYDPEQKNVKTGYFSRTTDELPVMSRWLELPENVLNKAKYIKLVLYSKEQLMSEADINGKEYDPNWTDWNIVSILADDNIEMSPIPPITMMRNALGMHEGGNGVPLNREEYLRSVEYWKYMINVKTVS